MAETGTSARAMPQARKNTTEVRMAVARFELILATPNLARIAVAAANKAERRDQ
jgi:hypothetical protein